VADEPDEVTALIARALAVCELQGRAVKPTEARIAQEVGGWLCEAGSVRDVLDEAGLLLRPGAGGTSEHPELVRQVLDASEIRKAHYAHAAAVVDAQRERWKAQGAAEERLRMLNERKSDG
jgi:hypothetical protein